MIFPSASRPARLAALVVLLWGTALGAPAWAQPSDVVIDEANPAAALGSEEQRAANPIRTGAVVMELIDRANAALEAGDGARAARYFEAVVSAVPQNALGHRKLCEARSLAGDFDGAIQACRTALEQEGSTMLDHLRHLAVILARPAQPTPDDVAAVDGSLSHVEEQHAANADLLDLSCQFALRLNDTERLSTCLERLEAVAPHDSRAATYAWARAMRAHDEKGARAAFDRAQELHHDPRKLEEMRATMTREFPNRTVWYLAAGLIILAGLGLLLALRFRKPLEGRTSPTLGPIT